MFKQVMYTVLSVLMSVLAGSDVAFAGLKSSEVLVVANSGDADSVALANYYIKTRKIPSKNLVLLPTSKGYGITRQNYNSQIRDPLIKAINRAGLAKTIRCICLVRGIPVRVEAPVVLPRALVQTYEIVNLDNLKLISLATGFASTVGVTFPKTPGARAPLEDYFKPQKTPAPPHPRDASRVIAEFEKQMKLAESRTRLVKGASQAIAFAQLRVLNRNLLGLKSLISLCKRLPHKGMDDISTLSKQLSQAEGQIAKQATAAMSQSQVISHLNLISMTFGSLGAHSYIQNALKVTADQATDASVDSELALIWSEKYPLEKWQDNPMYWRAPKRQQIVMTARLDGPSSAVVRRMIKDSASIEQTGLTGRVYIDAGGMVRAKEYNKHFTEMADFIKDNSELSVLLDTEEKVFRANSCHDASLYVGWYSRGKYVRAFLWNKGALAWHVAGAEAQRLRSTSSTQWCPQLLLNGVVATLGSVNEPFLSAFPLPEDFFKLLLTGKYTLAECYWRCIPHTSWRMTLIGDPLYNPFKANPQAKTSSLPRGLAP